ncbi:uncharacterized protein LOC106779742 [Vigna radiata var. radiata]|uniref:Uncharacterized protein LOC106779742 n=1 Tax=Vigna radiata var. radiata TaxID=3916 RepID=A0A1S3VYJ8_VIGRR|nr:uncharacterized protein LOC106779742 [Vigna radiata var. radiata]
MTDAKPVTTPMSPSCDLSTDSDASTSNVSEYCQIVGSLQYLSLTRPNVSFSVNKLSQYMVVPTKTHMQVAERILQHLKGIIDHGDIVDRRSMAAYIIYYGSNAISWSCKKQPSVAKSSIKAEYHTIGIT